jgi:hypothetical protein
MSLKIKYLLTLIAMFAVTAFAADVDGNWKATAQTENGTLERTFTFKADGTKLTGETTSEMMGKSTITDGKIDGDNLSFTIKVKFQDQDMTLNYKGKVSGNTMKLNVDFPGGPSIEWNAKRV